MNAPIDVLIVGAGPAGASAALWARSLDLTARVLEAAAEPGGQLHRIHFEPADLAGAAAGNGAAIARRMRAQMEAAGVDLCLGDEALGIASGVRGTLAVRGASGASHEARTLIIATGLTRRRLGVPGERELEGRGVSDSATRDRDRLAGKHVVVAGGGDAGYENAMILAGAGCEVDLLVRGAPQARQTFKARAASTPRIRVHEDASVIAVLGRSHVEAVRVRAGGRTIEIPCEALVVKVGNEPNTGWCREAVACDAEGYVQVDASLAASVRGIWAAGDVCRPLVPGLAPAIGQGALAAAAARQMLALER